MYFWYFCVLKVRKLFSLSVLLIKVSGIVSWLISPKPILSFLEFYTWLVLLYLQVFQYTIFFNRDLYYQKDQHFLLQIYVYNILLFTNFSLRNEQNNMVHGRITSCIVCYPEAAEMWFGLVLPAAIHCVLCRAKKILRLSYIRVYFYKCK